MKEKKESKKSFMDEKEIRKIYEEMAALQQAGGFILFPEPTEPVSRPRFHYNGSTEPGDES